MRWSTTESSTLTLALRWPRRSSKERDGIIVDHETLRRWLVGQGLWQVKQRRRHYRQRRERRHRFGELVQFDGSHHEWFESRGESCCLMNMVDDATSTTLTVLFEGRDHRSGDGRLLWEWIKRYGIPQGVYCDRKNAFVLDREPTIGEQLAGVEPKSRFELACEKLGIEVIVARSATGKGAGGAQPRSLPGSIRQRAALGEHQHHRGCQSIPGRAIPAGYQRAVCQACD